MHTKSLFISHAWRYSEPYDSMVRLLNARPYFSWKNYSVPEIKALPVRTNFALEEALRRQIRPVQCVIIIGGMWASYSRWIQFELDFAHAIGKPIVGVRPRAQIRMPSEINLKSTRVVNWNTDAIVSAVREIS